MSPVSAEKIDDRLYVLGQNISLDGRVSWLPSDVTGYQSVNCFVLECDDLRLVIDTGVAAQCQAILEGVRSIGSEDRPTSIFLTRAESDAVGNLEALCRNFRVDHIYTGGAANPFDNFDAALPPDERTVEPEIGRISPGDRLEFGSSVALTVIRPLLRVLATYWAYEESTRTLFTTDAFGHETVASASASRIIDVVGLRDVAEIERRMLEKYAYLKGGVGLGVIGDDLKKIFEEREVAAIAPTHGPVIRGTTAVRESYELMAAALKHLANG